MGVGKWFKKAAKSIDKEMHAGAFRRGKRDCLRRKKRNGEQYLSGGCTIETQIHYGIRPESDRPKTQEQKIAKFKQILKGARRDKPTAKQTKGVKSGNPQQTKGVKNGNTTETKGMKNGN